MTQLQLNEKAMQVRNPILWRKNKFNEFGTMGKTYSQKALLIPNKKKQEENKPILIISKVNKKPVINRNISKSSSNIPVQKMRPEI